LLGSIFAGVDLFYSLVLVESQRQVGQTLSRPLPTPLSVSLSVGSFWAT
jgi:hypothetical protein